MEDSVNSYFPETTKLGEARPKIMPIDPKRNDRNQEIMWHLIFVEVFVNIEVNKRLESQAVRCLGLIVKSVFVQRDTQTGASSCDRHE